MAHPFLSFQCRRPSLTGSGSRLWCADCAREVVDLDALPAEEAAALFGSAASVCVRFAAIAWLAAATPARADDPSPPPPPLQEEVVTGALDKSVIVRAMSPLFDELQMAYERRLAAAPALAGRMVVRFDVVDGKVVEVDQLSSTLSDPELERAVRDGVGRLAFPQGSYERIVVTYPFVFAPSR